MFIIRRKEVNKMGGLLFGAFIMGLLGLVLGWFQLPWG